MGIARRTRLAVSGTLAAVLLTASLAGCSALGALGSGPKPTTTWTQPAASAGDSQQVSAVGISIDIPKDWAKTTLNNSTDDSMKGAWGKSDNSDVVVIIDGGKASTSQIDTFVSQMSDQMTKDGATVTPPSVAVIENTDAARYFTGTMSGDVQQQYLVVNQKDVTIVVLFQQASGTWDDSLWGPIQASVKVGQLVSG